MKSLLVLTLSAFGFAIAGAIATGATDISPDQTELEAAACGSLSNEEDFRRLTEAYARIKRSTGRDPSIYAVSAEIGLNLYCHSA